MDLFTIKQRYGIVGHDPALDHAINIAVQVATTDLSVLIMGESGVGKEAFPKIIHDFSTFKHGPYITVNCGAIPEGTIDSELFGHEKGSFTGAVETRKGYFEVANNGTIFLDEVTELPMATQVRLLRVLETGDFMKVGSSTVQKTKVRIIAATNINIGDKIVKSKFREDLYYRLNSVPIQVPPLRERGNDIYLLFMKFASDFAAKYRFPPLELTPDAVKSLEAYRFPGNIRQLKNITEQISLIEKKRKIDASTLENYLMSQTVSNLPVLVRNDDFQNQDILSKEFILKILSDFKVELAELKKTVSILAQKSTFSQKQHSMPINSITINSADAYSYSENNINAPVEEVPFEDNFSIAHSEKELIIKALEKNGNNRKLAAQDLGISERTLYRKIKDFNL